MDLKPLTKTGNVSPQEFRGLFEARLGHLFPRAMTVLTTLGPKHSFSVANVIHLGFQKGNVETIITALEKWCETVTRAPNLVAAHVDTKVFFDTLYGESFMRSDTIDGVGPFSPITGRGSVPGTRPSGLWVPS